MSPEATVKGLKNCYISNAVDGTNDDMLWNDSEEDENVGLSVRSMKAPDCEDGDSNTDCKGR